MANCTLETIRYKSGNVYKVHGRRGLVLHFCISNRGHRFNGIEGEITLIEMDATRLEIPQIIEDLNGIYKWFKGKP